MNMDYNIKDFINSIKQALYDNFPNMNGEYPNNTGYMQTRSAKHPKTPMPVRDVALGINSINYINDDMMFFDIGNDYAERKYPYYHILEDSPVIRKRGRANEKSGGSQMKIVLMSNRDFNKVSWNGKTFSKEYSKNVRGNKAINKKMPDVYFAGKRKQIIDNSTRYVSGFKINMSATTYKNEHYRYIERTLDVNLPFIAQNFNLAVGRVVDSGLQDDYLTSQWDTKNASYDNISDYIHNILEL